MNNVERAHHVAMKAVYEHYALQKVHELTFILSLLEKDDLVVEIGCDAGGTSWAIKEMGVRRHIGIDLPGEKYSSGLAWQGPADAEMIWSDSHKPETKSQLCKLLDKETIDFLIIDGDHTYAGVSEDFRMYSQLCSGLVIFHDICEHHELPEVQVHRFYADKVKQGSYPHVEYVSENDTTWGGVGVLDLSYAKRLEDSFSESTKQ